MEKEIEPNTEAIHRDTAAKTEWQYYNEHCNPVHLSKVVHKDKPLIFIYPFSYSRERGLSTKKIKTIELRGWEKIKDVPTSLRSGDKIKLTSGSPKYLMSFLYKAFPDIEKLVIDKSGKSRFSKKSITFGYQDFDNAIKAIGKETRSYEIRRKTAIANSLSKVTSKVEGRKTKLSKGGISHYLSFYSEDISLSNEDIDSILSLLSFAPAANISVTENFIQTKDKINVAYLDDVIDKFKSLLKVKNDNEKDWQDFFEKHGWILANLFPFQVVMREREAYVGGKTISNKEGRVVDFLFQNGFRDNYALLEIKTHNKSLIKSRPYREPDTYAIHDDLSGAISQCLDQKNTFLTDMGQKHSVLDPKVILVSGMKSKLNESQTNCFELTRANQKNVEIVTFDELLEKINGLKDILKS
ncbi:Shedu immune nuclease family protein [Salinivibrio proteolyticus]|uniref:Shedu immune nuclease family protein n=1 Tax=Salinivibrio proteolyticus TaxID=334715 RepID=UPI00098911AB|nr:Shedu immune nuclease family protein [Salinivibrio proteolyticus]OOF30116.1 hypothetical protein BZJ20_11780 [Salinivibrio proteolyticus]